MFPSYKMRKLSGPNPLYLLEVRQHWIKFQTVLNRSAHNIPVPNLFLVGLISELYSNVCFLQTVDDLASVAKPL